MRIVSVMRTTTPGNLVAGNPVASTSTVYVPTGNKVAVNKPDASLLNWRSTSPVASFLMLILAFAITAPVASCTTPPIAPVAPPCANIVPVKIAMKRLDTITLRRKLIFFSN